VHQHPESKSRPKGVVEEGEFGGRNGAGVHLRGRISQTDRGAGRASHRVLKGDGSTWWIRWTRRYPLSCEKGPSSYLDRSPSKCSGGMSLQRTLPSRGMKPPRPEQGISSANVEGSGKRTNKGALQQALGADGEPQHLIEKHQKKRGSSLVEREKRLIPEKMSVILQQGGSDPRRVLRQTAFESSATRKERGHPRPCEDPVRKGPSPAPASHQTVPAVRCSKELLKRNMAGFSASGSAVGEKQTLCRASTKKPRSGDEGSRGRST